jgi:hypothetical protein
MSKHLLKAVEILKNRYKHEIYEGDWSYNLFNWTITISVNEENDNWYDVVAYKAKNNSTDWSDFIVLPSYPVQWELVYE